MLLQVYTALHFTSLRHVTTYMRHVETGSRQSNLLGYRTGQKQLLEPDNEEHFKCVLYIICCFIPPSALNPERRQTELLQL